MCVCVCVREREREREREYARERAPPPSTDCRSSTLARRCCPHTRPTKNSHLILVVAQQALLPLIHLAHRSHHLRLPPRHSLLPLPHRRLLGCQRLLPYLYLLFALTNCIPARVGISRCGGVCVYIVYWGVRVMLL